MIRKLADALKRLTGISRGQAWHLYSRTSISSSMHVCFTGTEPQKNYIKHLIFQDDGDEKFLGVQYFWKARYCLNNLLKFDFIVKESTPDRIPELAGNKSWYIPLWIMTYVDIPIPEITSSLKSDLRNIRNSELGYSITEELNEIEIFYHKMYLPYIQQRHGQRSIIMNFEELTTAVSNGKCQLLQILYEGEPVAGMLIDFRNSLPNLWSVGVLKNGREPLPKSVVSACYNFSFLYLQSKGYRRVSLGFTRSFTDDGVFRFKMKFEPKYWKSSGKGFVFLPVRTSLSLNRFFQDNPFIHFVDDNLKLARFIDDASKLGSEINISLKECQGLGLTSAQVFLTGQGSPALLDEKPFKQLDSNCRPKTEEKDSGQRLNEIGIYFLRHIMNVTTEKSLLVYGDSFSDPKTMETIIAAAESLGMNVCTHMLDSDLDLDSQCDELADLIEINDFNLLCECSGQYFYNTQAWQKALDRGQRAFSLGPVNIQSFYSCIGLVDAQRLEMLCDELKQRLQRASVIRIYDEAGSDLRVSMKRPFLHKLLARAGLQTPVYSRVFQPVSALTSSFHSSFMGGQVAFCGYSPTIEGILVIDGYMWPPKNIGKLKRPIKLTIEKGQIAQISGADEADTLDRWLPGNERQLEHICIGVNPFATMDHSLIEAERVFGACNFGFGGYPHHTDGVISSPTLEVDGEVIIQKGTVKGWERESLITAQ